MRVRASRSDAAKSGLTMKAPIDYESPYDRPVKPPRERRQRGLIPGKLRIVYWIVMLSAIAFVLWYIRHMLTSLNLTQ